MAEHTLTIKAKLDTEDAKKELENLEKSRVSRSGKQGKSGKDEEDAAKGLNELRKSINSFKAAVLTSGIGRSLGKFAENIKLFGDNTDQIVDDLGNLTKSVVGATAAFGPVGAIMASWAFIIEKLTRNSENSKEAMERQAKAEQERAKAIEAAQKRMQQFSKVFEDLRGYSEDKSIRDLARNGTDAEQYTKLLELYGRRKNAQKELDTLNSISNPSEATINRANQVFNILRTLDSQIDTLESGRLASARNRAENYIDKGDKQGIIDEIKSLYIESGDAAQEQIKVFTEALKTLNENIDKEAEKERQALFERWRKEGEQTKALDDARKEWQVSENDHQAAKNKNIEYFKTVMEDSKQGMERSITEQDFTKNRSRYEMARSQIESLSPKLNDFSSLMQMLVGGSTSGFSSLGFGMGETIQATDTIERQIDQIIRLMQEQISRQLQYVNQSTTL